MYKLSPAAFPSLLYDFSVCKIDGAPTVWVSKSFLSPGIADTLTPAELKTSFSDTFAYMVPGGITLDSMRFELDDERVVQAERYGGFGIGENGGGARCGNVGPYQVKGIGKNPLASHGGDIHHSYGALKAQYAIYEAIYSEMLGRLLPFGCAKVYGVMLTGKDTAFVRGTVRGWGGLLVRESVLRPANFMRARAFRPAPEFAETMMSDVWRVRRSNRDLMKAVVDVEGFGKIAGEFMARSAYQLSFARIARLSHGALTSSNICLDGRWLDLTNTTFLNSREDLGGGNRLTPTFYEEIDAPIGILYEFATTFSKYTGVKVDLIPLIAKYKTCLNRGLNFHLLYLFGLPLNKALFDATTAPLEVLKTTVMNLLSKGTVVFDKWPLSLPDDDPILLFIEALFLSLANPSQARDALLNEGLSDEKSVDVLISAFSTLVKKAFSGQLDKSIAYRDFVALTFAEAFKRTTLAEFFYKWRLETVINRTLDEGADVDLIGRLMRDSIDISSWAFSKAPSTSAVLFRSESVVINLDGKLGAFTVGRGGDIEKISDGKIFCEYIAQLPSELLIMHEFSFVKYLTRLATRIDLMRAATAA